MIVSTIRIGFLQSLKRLLSFSNRIFSNTANSFVSEMNESDETINVDLKPSPTPVLSLVPTDPISKRSLIPEENESQPTLKKIKNDEETLIIKREPTRKMAMLLAYCGTGYFGMQKNPNVKTIEDDLLNAMLKAELILSQHVEVPQKMSFQRAARTDKGVSAVSQVVSLKCFLPKDTKKMVQDINEHLPNQIRVFGMKRVTKGFDSKNSCDFRTYCYVLPSFALAPKEIEYPNEDYRIPGAQIDEVNKFLNNFKGTHNFFNFTSGRNFEDESCKRYLVVVQCGQPFIQDGLEFVKIKLKGQSFILHQIRKMVGLTIAHIRGYTKPDTLTKAWAPVKVDIPIAPGLGLMLDFVHYELYDRKFGGNGFHEKLDWAEYQDEIHEFTTKFITPNIVLTEKNEKSMLSWMEQLSLHSYDIREPCPPILQDEDATEVVIDPLSKNITSHEENAEVVCAKVDDCKS